MMQWNETRTRKGISPQPSKQCTLIFVAHGQPIRFALLPPLPIAQNPSGMLPVDPCIIGSFLLIAFKFMLPLPKVFPGHISHMLWSQIILLSLLTHVLYASPARTYVSESKNLF